MKKFAIVISSGFGSGFLMPAPGTWGTAVAFLLTVALWRFGLFDDTYAALLLSVAFYGLGLLGINYLPDDWVDDDQRIVVDEMIGYWVTIIWIPISWTSLLLAFVLFRLFDIFKPLGIRKFDNIKTSWAVLVDDIVAGVYANLTLRIILILLVWQQ